jgi:hypothetical protein
MEDRHVEDTATMQGAMDSNNNDKPAAAAASTGGSAAAAAAASMSFPGVPRQPIGPPPVEEVPTTFPSTGELDNSGSNTGGGDAKGEGGGERRRGRRLTYKKHMVHLLISFTKLEYYSKFGKTTKEHTRSQ